MSKPPPEREQISPHDLPTLIQEGKPQPLGEQAAADDAASAEPEAGSDEIMTDSQAITQLAPGKKAKVPIAAMSFTRIGDYDLLGEVGRGGMGVVFKARDVRLGRIVALKMLSGGIVARPEDVQRFETEEAAAAQLQHPNIVALFGSGAHEGQPYFSMEYVQGRSLADRILSGVLPCRQAAIYLERTARAVHFAHSKGIIHRDLKPANILLDEQDQPKITDFGLAKLMHSDSSQTRTGTVVGTPSYMAPEQANARKDIGPSCDIYSLGAILYELITGNPPFRGETALATLHMVAYKDPVSPSMVNPKVDRDLETICLKCLEKEPARRYPTAAALADDLQRYLKGEPISARRLGVAGRLWKWARRKPGTALTLLGTLVLLIGFALYQWQVAVTERSLRKEAEKEKKLAEDAKKKIHQSQQLLQQFFYLGQIQQAYQAWKDADLNRAIRLLNFSKSIAAEKKLRDWEWYYLESLCDGKSTLEGHTRRVRSLAYNKDGTLLASAGGNAMKPGEVKIWNPITGHLVAALPKLHTNIVTQVAFSPVDALLATASADGTVRLWNTQTWKKVGVLKGHSSHVTGLAFSPKGKKLITVGGDNCVLVWDLSKPNRPTCLHKLREHSAEITSVAFSPKGDVFATGSYDETVRIWDEATGKVLHTLRGHQGEVMCLTFSPNGKILVSGGGPGMRRGQVILWDVGTGERMRTHYGLSDRILSVAISRQGRVAAGDSDGQVFMWAESESSESLRLRVDTQPVYAVAFSPDGKHLATTGSNGRIRIWNSDGGQESYRLEGHRRIVALAYSPDGKWLASAGQSSGADGNSIHLWDAGTGKRLQTLTGPTRQINGIAFSPDSKHLASAGSDCILRIYDVAKHKQIKALKGHTERIMAVAFHPDGKTIATGSDDHTIRLWDVDTGKTIKELKVHNGTLALAFSPNSRYLASGDYVGKVRLWDLKKNTCEELQGPKGWINSVAFSPDSIQLAWAGNDQIIRLWDVETGDLYTLEGATRSISCIVFHPKGKRLVSAGADHMVRLWDRTTRREILQLDGPEGELRSVAFSPDGSKLAAAGRYTGIFIWDAKPTTEDSR